MFRKERSLEGLAAGDAVRGVRGWLVMASLIVLGAFLLYWLSAIALEARKALPYFGSDPWYYIKLAQPDVIGRTASDYHLDRLARFHPTTVALAVVWMKMVSPLTAWFDPPQLLRVMSAAIGALGVWAAISAFGAVLSRGFALLFGLVYAVSFGVWYFSSIEESKIVAATLSALYIAGYLHLRQRWSNVRAALLLAILLLACLNEIVSGFLVAIPFVDAFLHRRTDRRLAKWIGAQVLVGVVSLGILEGVLNRWLLAGTKVVGEGSHFAMMIDFMFKMEHGVASLHVMLANWLFFNIAAPAARADYAMPLWPLYKGYFEPSLANYLASPATVALAILFGLMVAACLLPRYRPQSLGAASGIFLPLLAYTGVRGLFFFVFNPPEALLFSPPVTLAHMLIVGIPFAASRLPAKGAILAAFAALLLVANGRFFFWL